MDRSKIIVCKDENFITITCNGKRMIVNDKSLFDKDKDYIKDWYINLYGKEG